eukprot:scaffold3716_cov69-Cylindrotheca_fusiformis.AAC.27
MGLLLLILFQQCIQNQLILVLERWPMIACLNSGVIGTSGNKLFHQGKIVDRFPKLSTVGMSWDRCPPEKMTLDAIGLALLLPRFDLEKGFLEAA